MTDIDLNQLGNELYQRAMVRREEEVITDPNGDPIRWLLDSRMPMLDAQYFATVGKVSAQRLHNKGYTQVAGLGYGAYPFICSILSATELGFKGGFIREQRKPYGRQRLIEGPLDKNLPLVLVDDVLNSGKTLEKAIQNLKEEGYNVTGIFTLFCFTWGKGKDRLEGQGYWVDSLLDLNLKNAQQSSSDSA
jgi:orotate phosphoribosyltransferase